MSSLRRRSIVRGQGRQGLFRGAAAPVFDPRHVPGLVLWLRGDWSPIVPNESNVARWDDLSGNGNHAAQSTEANQPDNLASGINGRRNVDFVAANEDRLDIADDTTIQDIFDGGGYIGGALRADALDVTASYIFSPNGDTALYGISGTNALRLSAKWSGTNGIWASPNDAIATGTPFFFGVSYDADDVDNNPEMTINGASVSVSELATPDGTRTSDAGVTKNIGNHPTLSRPWDGPMAELVLYNQAVSAANQTRLNNYFSRIHGIALA